MKSVTGYVRVSRVAGRSGDSFQSPDAQEDAIRAHCKARRLRVVDVVHELDASGGTMRRPKLQALIRRIEAGELDGIVVARLDRFARTLLGGVGALEEIHAAGGFVQTVEGGIDTSTSGGAMGELQLNLLLTLAQWERTTRAEGFEVAKQRAVSRGVHISGTVPVGYLRPRRGARLEVDAAKASAVRDAFELRATGATLSEVARQLDHTLPGGPSGSGAWNRGTVARLLGNRAYVGEARQGRHVQPQAHIAIVSETTFATVQALARHREPASRGNGARSLLAGLVVCGSCGYALDRNKVAKHYLVYRCRGHSATGDCTAPTSAMAHTLEHFVSEAAFERLEGFTIERVPVSNEVDEFHAQLATARSRRAPFEDPEYVAALGIEAATRALAKVDAEVAALEEELARAIDSTTAADLPIPDPQQVRELWPGLTVDGQREVLAAMIDTVTVSRGVSRNVPLTDRVRILWKGEQARVERPSRGRRRNGAEVEAGIAAA
jgi:DNA invertase Pin-like site-specific DNA recombinase